MFRILIAGFVAWSVSLGCIPPTSAQSGDIVVFAAASMKDALDSINAQWQAQTGKKAVIS